MLYFVVGMTVLHRSAMEGYLEGCHLFMMYGKASVNARCEGGYTPIMWAAEHKQTAMANFLAHYGADLSLVDNVRSLANNFKTICGIARVAFIQMKWISG